MLGPENDKQKVLFIQPVFQIIFGVIKQIYHAWEGYLRKIGVLRLNFPRHSAREIFSSLDWYFSQIPLPNMIYQYNVSNRYPILKVMSDFYFIDICISDRCPFFKFSNQHPILKSMSFFKCSNLWTFLTFSNDITDICHNPNQ